MLSCGGIMSFLKAHKFEEDRSWRKSALVITGYCWCGNRKKNSIHRLWRRMLRQ